MNCLLPIDWLELLESGNEGSMEEHLAVCPSCRELVESLRKSTAEGAFASDWLSTVDLSSARSWTLSDPDEVRPGQIWLTKESFKFDGVSYSDVERVFVLVLDHPVEDYDRQWVDVAPLLPDTDSATATDLLLDANQTTLDIPMAAYLRYQTILMTNQLGACVGELTDAGQEVLQAVKSGDWDGARFGAQLESSDDIRLAHTQFLGDLMDQLGAGYANAVSAEAASVESSLEAQTERSLREAIEGKYDALKGQIARVYELKPVSGPSGPLVAQQLAAASVEADVNPFERFFSVREKDVELSGTLELRYHEHGADLTFWFRSVEGLPPHVRVVLCVCPSHGEPIASPAVEPQRDTAVIVASGAQVLPIEVAAVKVKLNA